MQSTGGVTTSARHRPTATHGCDGHHEKSDLSARGDRCYSDAESVEPVYPRQRLEWSVRWLDGGDHEQD
jgi:hypothetical protein